MTLDKIHALEKILANYSFRWKFSLKFCSADHLLAALLVNRQVYRLKLSIWLQDWSIYSLSVATDTVE